MSKSSACSMSLWSNASDLKARRGVARDKRVLTNDWPALWAVWGGGCNPAAGPIACQLRAHKELPPALFCGTKNFHSGRAHPLRRYARQRVSRAPVPFVGAALGCWGGRPHRPMVRRWGARGLVAFGSAEPRIAKSDEKLARVFVGSLCGACGVLLRLLPAVSDLFSHPTSHRSSPEWAHLRYLPTRRAGLRFHRGALTLRGEDTVTRRISGRGIASAATASNA